MHILLLSCVFFHPQANLRKKSGRFLNQGFQVRQFRKRSMAGRYRAVFLISPPCHDGGEEAGPGPVAPCTLLVRT